MKKHFSKIVGLSLGIAMAIGVGVSAGISNGKVTRLDAATTYVWQKMTSTSEFVNGTVLLITQDAYYLDASQAATGNTPKMAALTLSGGLPTLTADNTCTLTVSGSGSSIKLVKSTDTAKYLYTNTSNNGTRIGNASTNGQYWTISSAGTNEFYLASNASTARYLSRYGTTDFRSYTNTNTNANLVLYKLVESSSSGATVDSISLSGSMSTTSYTTVQSWNNAGLTATVAMSDSSTYSGSIDWTYSPATPAAAVIANSKLEGTNFSVTATASAGGKSSNNVTKNGISITYATVAQLAAATPAEGTLSGVIAKGIVSQVNQIYTDTYHNATYFISDDGTTTNQYEVFQGKGVDNADLTNVNDLKVGDVVVVYGNVTTYNGTKEFASGNYLLSLDRPTSLEPEITITDAGFTMNVGDADVPVHATANNIPDGGSVAWESGNESIATVANVGGTYKVHAVGAGTTSIIAKILDGDSATVASNSINVTVLAVPVSVGDTITISSVYSATTYYLSGINNNLGTCSTVSSDAMVLTVESGNTSGTFALRNGTNYLKAINDNKLQTETTITDASSWTIVTDGTKVIITNAEQTDRFISYNHNSDTGDCTKNRFAAYKSQQSAAILINQVVAPQVDEVTVYGDPTADAQNNHSVVKEFLYDVTYVDPTNPGTQAVSVSVLNSSDGTDGASVTTAPANGSFSVTFTADDTYTITVTSIENSAKSDSTTIVVSNIYAPTLTNYALYEGTTVSTEVELADGDYVVYYGDGALKASITSGRADYEAITPTGDNISTDNGNIVWRITRVGDYYTIYNVATGKYLASTGAKNKAQLLDSGADDMAKWSVTISTGTFEFVNKKNTANGVNATLRKNTTYGFACYATDTGGALTLYKRATKDSIGDIVNTISALRFDYEELGAAYTYSDAAIRFGSAISQADWNQLNSESNIQGYGVLVAANSTLGGKSIKERYAEASVGAASVEAAINSICSTYSIGKKIVTSKPNPAVATADQQEFLGVSGDYYIWTVQKPFGEAFTSTFNAVAFILIDGDIVFLQEESISPKQIAMRDVPSDTTLPEYEPLHYMANMA